MHLLYCSALFLSILGSFLFFIWLVVKISNQATYQIALEPEAKDIMWKNKDYKYVQYKSQSNPKLSHDHYSGSIINDEEESRLMNELDNIKDKQELKEWFELLKVGYKQSSLPQKVQLRISTMLRGCIWFNEKEYTQRIQEGKPVKNITEREYALEKKLEIMTSNGSDLTRSN